MPEERVIFRGTITGGNLDGAEVIIIGPIPLPQPPGCTVGATDLCDGRTVHVRFKSGGIERHAELVIRSG